MLALMPDIVASPHMVIRGTIEPESHMTAKKSVLVIGLQPALLDFAAPEYAATPGLTAEQVSAELKADAERLHELGYAAELCLTDLGETAEMVVSERLRMKQFDCIAIGAGMRTIPKHFLLFEQLINVVHELAPQAKLCFTTTPDDTADAVQRWV